MFHSFICRFEYCKSSQLTDGHSFTYTVSIPSYLSVGVTEEVWLVMSVSVHDKKYG